MDEQQRSVAFAAFMGELAAMLPGAVAPMPTIDAYRAALADLPFDVVRAAAKQCAAEMAFPNSPNMRLPSIGEIRAKAATLIGQAEALPTAGAAWSQLTRHLVIGVDGFEWRKKDQVHALVIRAAQEFGEHRFVTRETDNAGTDFAQFERIYNAVVTRSNQMRLTLPETRQIVTALADGFRAKLPAPNPQSDTAKASKGTTAEPARVDPLRMTQTLREALNNHVPKSRAQIDREAALGRLRARETQLVQWIQDETSDERRAIYQGLLDNTRRMLAHSTSTPMLETQGDPSNGR